MRLRKKLQTAGRESSSGEVMGKSREVLLKLVRMAMGWETDFSLPEGIAWKEVLDEAYEQGIVAIVLDGYEKHQSNCRDPKSVAADEMMYLMDAIGQQQVIEFNYLNQRVVLQKLSEILHGNAIPFMLMKGFACGQYYPVAQHRPCGDIDIYPGSKFEESIIALKDAGVESDPYYYRHSALYIDNVMIENHRVLGDLRGPRRQMREFETLLEKEAEASIKSARPANVGGVDIPGGLFPSANFNALFLPWHVSAHFAFEKVTLRHLLDWALFLVHESKEIDVKLFSEAKKRYTYGYSKMADILTNLSIRYLNMPTDGIPSEIVNDAHNFDNRLADRVFGYMFVGQPKERDPQMWKERWNNVKQVWRERWKYTEIYDVSMLHFLFIKARGVLLKEGE